MARDGRLVDRAPLQSDAELLRAIRDDLHIVYDVILQRPPPNNVRALLSRLDREPVMSDRKERASSEVEVLRS
jgi:hypothetical protein